MYLKICKYAKRIQLRFFSITFIGLAEDMNRSINNWNQKQYYLHIWDRILCPINYPIILPRKYFSSSKSWRDNQTKKRKTVLLSFCFFLLCQGTFGDIISSSVTCDGSYWVHSSAEERNHTYNLNLFTTDPTRIDRDIQTNNEFISSSSINGSGALLIDEYNNLHPYKDEDNSPWCIFHEDIIPDERYDEISSSGILVNAGYASSRIIGVNSTSAKTAINGSGVILMDRMTSNDSAVQEEKSSIHGLLNVFDYVKFGDE